MKRILNSRTLAIMTLGIGPFALLFWASGAKGETILLLWFIAGVIIKLTINSKKEKTVSISENKKHIENPNEEIKQESISFTNELPSKNIGEPERKINLSHLYFNRKKIITLIGTL